MAEFNFKVGRSADVLSVQFYVNVISDVKNKISNRRRNRDFTATEMVVPVGLETEKDLVDECRRAPVLSLLSLLSSIQVWMSERQVSRRGKDFELSTVRKRLRLNRLTLNQVRKRFCVED